MPSPWGPVVLLACLGSALAGQGSPPPSSAPLPPLPPRWAPRGSIAPGDTVRDSLTRRDDDSGGRCNARLTVRLPQTGDYFIVVTSSERRATGPFTLTVAAGPKPVSLAPCTR